MPVMRLRDVLHDTVGVNAVSRWVRRDKRLKLLDNFPFDANGGTNDNDGE